MISRGLFIKIRHLYSIISPVERFWREASVEQKRLLTRTRE